MHSYTVISFYRVAAGATWVMSSIWWPFLGANGSSSPNLSEVGCFNSSQNTVLIGSEFEGVPIVLLLNFIAFLVGARKLRLFLWNTTKTSRHRSSVDGFFLPVPPTDFAQPLLHNKEELLGLRTTGASCWQWGVSSGFLSPQRSLETMMWQWHINKLHTFNKLLYWFISELDWISELLLTFICLAKSWALNFVFQVHWVNTPSLRTRINHCGWSQVWTGTSVMVTLKTSPITHGCFVGPFNMFGKSVKQATPFSKCWLSLTWTPREPFVTSRRADAWTV